jgi:hypothetical protein
MIRTGPRMLPFGSTRRLPLIADSSNRPCPAIMTTNEERDDWLNHYLMTHQRFLMRGQKRERSGGGVVAETTKAPQRELGPRPDP